MSNLYSRIHRLKSQGWTWDYFLQQIQLIYAPGIDEKTLYALYRHPHRKTTQHVTDILQQLHDRCFPSIFPPDTQALLNIYNRILNCQKHPSYAADVSDFVTFLSTDVQFGSLLRQARLNWLMADIHLDQLPQLRDNGKKAQLLAQQQAALNFYQKSLQLLIEHNELNTSEDTSLQVKVDHFTLYKVQQNMLACYLNALAAKTRYQDETLLAYLKNSNYIEASKAVLKDEPYQWLIARNGLRFSSISKNAADCRFFFQALVTANKAFSDIHYSPRVAPALSNSIEFKWALEQL